MDFEMIFVYFVFIVVSRWGMSVTSSSFKESTASNVCFDAVDVFVCKVG